MPFTLLVCGDLFSEKVNLELPFPEKPTLPELKNHVQNSFTAEMRCLQPPNMPAIEQFNVNRIQVYDDAHLKWVDLSSPQQLHEYDQLYCFQPVSPWQTDVQKDLPAPRPPTRPVALSQGVGQMAPQSGMAPSISSVPVQQQVHQINQSMPPPGGYYAQPSPQGHMSHNVSQLNAAAGMAQPVGMSFVLRNSQRILKVEGDHLNTTDLSNPLLVLFCDNYKNRYSTRSQPSYGIYYNFYQKIFSRPIPFPPSGAASLAGERPNVPLEERVRVSFQELDDQHKGWIESAELERAFRNRGIDFSASTVNELFVKADHPRDGRIDMQKWHVFAQIYPNTVDAVYYRGRDMRSEQGLRDDITQVLQPIFLFSLLNPIFILGTTRA